MNFTERKLLCNFWLEIWSYFVISYSSKKRTIIDLTINYLGLLSIQIITSRVAILSVKWEQKLIKIEFTSDSILQKISDPNWGDTFFSMGWLTVGAFFICSDQFYLFKIVLSITNHKLHVPRKKGEHSYFKILNHYRHIISRWKLYWLGFWYHLLQMDLPLKKQNWSGLMSGEILPITWVS